MFAITVFNFACGSALIFVCLAVLLVMSRFRLGPHFLDRVLALDLLTFLAVAIIALMCAFTAFYDYIGVAVALTLLGFLSTVALAYFALRRFEQSDESSKMSAEEETNANLSPNSSISSIRPNTITRIEYSNWD